MKKVHIFAAFAVAFLLLAVTGFVKFDNQVSAGECSVAPADESVTGKGINFTVSGDKITGKFKVKGDPGCKQTVTLATWVAPQLNGLPLSEQTLFDHSTKTFGLGEHTLTANLPVCDTDPNILHFYQADLLRGADPTAPDGTADYSPVWQRLMDWKHGGKECPTPPPAAFVECTNLNVNVLNPKQFEINATAETKIEGNVDIKNYEFNWGDGSDVTVTDSDSATHTYDEAGTYKVKATINYTENHESKTRSVHCSSKVSFDKPPVPPVAFIECTDLVLTVTNRDNHEIRATAETKIEGNIDIEDYTFNWGDGTKATVSSSNSATHRYSKPGSYSVKATISYTENDDSAVEKVNCSSEIVFERPVTPGKVLPNTGPAAIIAQVSAIGALGGSVHAFLRSRRS